MMLRFLRPIDVSWKVTRRRILNETSQFLERGLRDRSWGVRIPSIPVGKGSFSRVFSVHFWQQVLFESS